MHWPWMNVLGYAGLIVCNVGSNKGWFGPTNREMSGRYPTFITPAGWAFSIWGLIFLLQAAGTLLTTLALVSTTGGATTSTPRGSSSWQRAAVDALGYGWLQVWACEGLWLVLFPYATRASFVASAALLVGAFAAAASTLLRLRALPADVAAAGGAAYSWAVRIPTAINAAWLSVAMLLGICVLAASEGAPHRAQLRLGASLAAAASALALYVVLGHGELAWGLTVCWALAGIRAKPETVPFVRGLATAALAALAAAVAVEAARQARLFGGGVLFAEAAAAAGEPLLVDGGGGGGGGAECQ